MLILGLRPGELIDILQTTVLVTIAAAVVYAIALLRRELRNAAASLRQVMEGHRSVLAALNRAFARLEALEDRLDVKRPPRDP